MREITFDIETKMVAFGRGRLVPEELEITVVGVHDSETNEYTGYFVEDLPKLWPIIERADALIGYNSDHFDVPVLNRYYPGDLTKLRSIDLMAEVQKVLGRRVRLEAIAQATLGRGKSGDGLEAGTWWENGERDKVRDYCLDDVRLTRELYDFALLNGFLRYKDLRDIRDVKLDTRSWRKKGKDIAPLTHALPF